MEELAHSDFDNLVKQQLVYWQQLLRLQDWDIQIQYWPHEALEGDVARTIPSRNQKAAIIALRLPDDVPAVEKDWPPGEAADYDMSLVHELLHLSMVDMDSEYHWAEEQVCNHISKALVTLYRNGHPQSPHPSPSVDGTYSKDGSHGHYL